MLMLGCTILPMDTGQLGTMSLLWCLLLGLTTSILRSFSIYFKHLSVKRLSIYTFLWWVKSNHFTVTSLLHPQLIFVLA